MFSGAGNIAAATGLMKKEEFPTDLKVSSPSTTHMNDYKCPHVPINLPRGSLPPQPATLPHLLQDPVRESRGV